MATMKLRRIGRNSLAVLSLLTLTPTLSGCGEMIWGASTAGAGLLYLDIGLIPVRSYLGQIALSIFNGTFP